MPKIKKDPPYFCPRCDRNYPKWKDLFKHVDEAHPEIALQFREAGTHKEGR